MAALRMTLISISDASQHSILIQSSSRINSQSFASLGSRRAKMSKTGRIILLVVLTAIAAFVLFVVLVEDVGAHDPDFYYRFADGRCRWYSPFTHDVEFVECWVVHWFDHRPQLYNDIWFANE
jgi:hypothetical protein